MAYRGITTRLRDAWRTNKHANPSKHSGRGPYCREVKCLQLKKFLRKPQAINWVAVKELKLSYHNGYI